MKPCDSPFGDMTDQDWERAEVASRDGDDLGPLSIAADLQAGKIEVDDAHEFVLGWLNVRERRRGG
jgi:hypothetical protein